ncbi:hypothetical protein VTN77DRAFT_6633 [Rasamsonia byssochlamydoides]|uniref:uncharacterized protein n=1 Tax=Rasamsonia byssochlamydoides TaxID=89139 RepID=UPI0037440479
MDGSKQPDPLSNTPSVPEQSADHITTDRVLPFGLTTRPATFQRYVNDLFLDLDDYLNDFMAIYPAKPEDVAFSDETALCLPAWTA